MPSIHHLAVAMLLLCFAVVFPSHAHGEMGRTATGAVETDSHPHNESSHSQHECPVCRVTGTGMLLSVDLAPLVNAPTPQFPLPLDSAQPAPARTPLPFDGRAPPSV